MKAALLFRNSYLTAALALEHHQLNPRLPLLSRSLVTFLSTNAVDQRFPLRNSLLSHGLLSYTFQ